MINHDLQNSTLKKKNITASIHAMSKKIKVSLAWMINADPFEPSNAKVCEERNKIEREK